MKPKTLILSIVLAAVGRLPAAAESSRPGVEEASRPLKVCVTVPDLGSLAREVGGEEVSVVALVKGQQDPHFVEAKPSFIKELSTADLFIFVGLELEVGWAPNLLQGARNARVLPGADGFLDASRGLSPLEVPGGSADRSLGDVHAQGNPHYLVDPLSGLRVAGLIRDALSKLRPGRAAEFARRADDFSKRLGEALVGKTLAAKYDAAKLALLAEHGKLEPFLKAQGDPAPEGWLGRTARFRGAKVVVDHNLWPYFAARFGIDVAARLEPKPGIPPTSKHLATVIDLMKANRITAILAVGYFDPRHARFVAQQTGARMVTLSPQCGAEPHTDTYLDLVEFNVKALEQALGGAR